MHDLQEFQNSDVNDLEGGRGHIPINIPPPQAEPSLIQELINERIIAE